MHTEETGKVCNERYVFSGIFQKQCIGMVNVHDLVYESRHSPGLDFLNNSEIYKNTKVEDIENVFNISQKLLKRSLGYSSPSCTR